ncbi:hypothetical protein WKW77_07885 [Variovorax ureilyticus]|uniref:Uncharacterized protein n=1 Tax=Variovorax ureilyticus TaxID=1836198 RepID=A0ABU8VBY9_9BURK
MIVRRSGFPLPGVDPDEPAAGGDSIRTTVWGRVVIAGGTAGTMGEGAAAVRMGWIMGWLAGCRIVREGSARRPAVGVAFATLAGFAMSSGLEGAGAIVSAVLAGVSILGGCSRSASMTSLAGSGGTAATWGLAGNDGAAVGSLARGAAFGASTAGASAVRRGCGSVAGLGAGVSATVGGAGSATVCATGAGGEGARDAVLRINSTVRSTGLRESKLVPAIAITASASGSTIQRAAWTVRGCRWLSASSKVGRLRTALVVASGQAAAGAMTGCCIAIDGGLGIVDSGASSESSNA